MVEENTTTETTAEDNDDEAYGVQDYADNIINTLVDDKGLTYHEAYIILNIASQHCMDEILSEETPLEEDEEGEIEGTEEDDTINKESP